MKKQSKRSGRVSPDLRLNPPASIWLQYTLILFLSVIPYLPSSNGDFVFDDAESIVNNNVVNGKVGIIEVFRRDFWGNDISSPLSHKSYRPITTLTFWINYNLHGLSTIGYHVVNFALHATNSLLLMSVGKSLTNQENAAFISAAIFAVHPVHTESVANITGRAELLMTFFSLLAFRNHAKGDSSLFQVTILTILSMFSKEQGIMTLPILIVYELIVKSKKEKCLVLTLIFMFLGGIRFSINNFSTANFSKLDNPAAAINNLFWRMINYNYIWLYHVHLLIYPVDLCFDYSMGCIEPISRITDWRALSPALIGLSLFAAYQTCHLLPERRLALFCVLYGLLAFLPSSNLIVTVGFTVAERILYLPSIPFCLLCGLGISSLAKNHHNMNLIVVSILFLAGTRTFHRSEEWKNELSLYTSGLSVCPKNAKIHYNIGKVMGDLGRLKDAEGNYWNAIRLNPSYEQALNNLGNILQKEGELELAQDLLRRATELKPNFGAAWMNLAIVQMNLGQLMTAEKSFLQSLRVRRSAQCFFNLGVLYNKMKRVEEAINCWKNATSLNPSHKQAWTNLMVALDEQSRCSEVVSLAPSALKSVPMESSVHMQIGSCLAQNGDTIQARIHLEKAVEINPNSAVYRANLGVLYQRTQQWELAKLEYKSALGIDIKMEMARTNLRTVEKILNSRNGTFNNFQ